MREISEFLWSVGSNWVWLMSGLASVCIAIWLRIKRRPDIARISFWIVAGLCLLLAFFFAWRDEHRALLSEHEKNKPQLAGTIHQIAIGLMGKERPGATIVTLAVSISNLGMDSIVDGWSLYAIEPEHPERRIPATAALAMPGGIALEVDAGRKFLYPGSDALYQKTAETPLKRGGKATGVLAFIFDNTPKDKLNRGGVAFQLEFKDVTGLVYRVDSCGGKPEGKDIKFFPGTAPRLSEDKSLFPGPWEIVENRMFVNEKVQLDGRAFNHCLFQNVNFVYNGDKPTQIRNCTFKGSAVISSENASLNDMLTLLKGLGFMPNVANYSRQP